MTTFTEKFLQEIIKKSGTPIVNDKIFLEAKMIITDEICANKELKSDIQEKFDKESNLAGETTVNSGIIRRFFLKHLII